MQNTDFDAKIDEAIARMDAALSHIDLAGEEDHEDETEGEQ